MNILRKGGVTFGMFCPKCGSENANEAKYCRGCGTDVSNVIAVVEGKPTIAAATAERQIEFFSRGVFGLVAGTGFLIVSGISFAISMRLAVLGIFALAFGFIFLGTGISRLVRARALNRLRESAELKGTTQLSSGDTEFIKPQRSVYETDELTALPGSVTENTTTLLDKKDRR